MRIISGSARGTKLHTLEGTETRPTLDRVKEPLFSIINFNIENSIVLDLFAGSGALGLETLSRGAKQCVFCDNSNEASKVIKENILKIRMQEKSQIITKDYNKALESLKDIKFNIVFLDPPYATNFDILAIQKILEYNLLEEDGIIILETDSLEEKIESLKKININIYDIRKYGRVKLIFLNRKG